jgi:hypothetical protein
MKRFWWIAAGPLLALGLWLAFVREPSERLKSKAPTRGHNPLGSLLHDALASPIRGRVEQRVAAGGYTYLALKTEAAELLWAVTMGRGEPVGTRVSVRSMGHAFDFYSPRLQRTFSHLVFGIVSPAN